MIKFENVTKTYTNEVDALKSVNIRICQGEFVFLTGPSGSGKSTFLKLLIKEEIPTEGSIILNDKNLNEVKEKEIPYIRRKTGFVYQDFRLLYDKTVYDNIVFALRVIGASDREIKQRVPVIVEKVGLKGKELNYPNQLSGGEQQRVGLARALVTNPPIIIADEPTGNLDDKSADAIMKILYEVNAAGTTVIVVTHNKNIIKNSGKKRVIVLNKGSVVLDNLGGEENGN